MFMCLDGDTDFSSFHKRILKRSASGQISEAFENFSLSSLNMCTCSPNECFSSSCYGIRVMAWLNEILSPAPVLSKESSKTKLKGWEEKNVILFLSRHVSMMRSIVLKIISLWQMMALIPVMTYSEEVLLTCACEIFPKCFSCELPSVIGR